MQLFIFQLRVCNSKRNVLLFYFCFNLETKISIKKIELVTQGVTSFCITQFRISWLNNFKPLSFSFPFIFSFDVYFHLQKFFFGVTNLASQNIKFHFKLPTQRLNLYFSTFELITPSWKVKKFYFELMTQNSK